MSGEIKHIGNWIVEIKKENKLGQGGMGEVYLARHSTLGKPVAVKFLPPMLANDQEFNRRFFEEAKTQARLSHPNIAQILDCIGENGQLFLVIEYLSGGTIADILDRAKAPIETAKVLTWIKQVLSALNYAHQNGVIHRDIKSTNIMLDQHGNAKVLDFGIALEMSSNRLTKTGVSVGTPYYMSPEQIKNPKKIDHRTDVYSTATVLYEMLTGRLPFDATKDNDREIDEDEDFYIRRVQVYKPPQSLRKFKPNITNELEEIVLRGLAKEPSQRYSGCGEFLKVIETYQEQVLMNAKKAPSFLVPNVTTKIVDKGDTGGTLSMPRNNYSSTPTQPDIKNALPQLPIKVDISTTKTSVDTLKEREIFVILAVIFICIVCLVLILLEETFRRLPQETPMPQASVKVETNTPSRNAGVEGETEEIGGVKSGVEGGVVSGVIGGTIPAADPPPPPPPPPPEPPLEPPPPSIVRRSEGVIRGNALERPSPDYPALAKTAHVEGDVVVEITIGEDGSVVGARVVNGHPLLQQAALSAAKRWKFKPTVLNDTAVKVSGVLTFRFKLS